MSRSHLSFVVVAFIAACGGVTMVEGAGDDDDLQPGTGGKATGGLISSVGGALVGIGGGSTSDDFDETLRAYCAAATAAGCDHNERTCLDDLRLLVAASVDRGCPNLLVDSMWCGIEAGLECGEGLPHPPYEPCQPTILDVAGCLGDSLAFPELCTPWSWTASDAVGCGVDCVAFGVVCAMPGDCACTHGPLAGERFASEQACEDPVTVATQSCWLAGI